MSVVCSAGDHGDGRLTVDGGVTIAVDTESVRRLSRAIGAAYDAMRTAEGTVLKALASAQPELALSAIASPRTAAWIPMRMAELAGPTLALAHAAVNLSLECDRVAAAYDEVEGRASAWDFGRLWYLGLTGALSTRYTPRTARVGDPVTLGDRPAPRELSDLVDWFTPRPGDPPGGPGRIDVIERQSRGPDGATRTAYVVLLPGTTSLQLPRAAYLSREPRDIGANLRLASNQSTPEVDVLPEALARAGVPDHAQVTLIGHSQGGMTAMAAAVDPRFARRFKVAHIVTFGSPIAYKHMPDGVKVLSVEHRSDPVPALDFAPNQATARHVTVQVGEGQPGLRGGAHHNIERYAAQTRDLQRSAHPSLAAFDRELRDAGVLAPRGTADRGVVRVRRVEVELNPVGS